MLKAKFMSYYRKQGGRKVFVYTVTGTDKELKQYAEAQGDNIRYLDDDEKKAPLFFSSRPLSTNKNETVELLITNNSNVVADDSDKVFRNEDLLERAVIQEQAKLMALQAMGMAGDGSQFLSNFVDNRHQEQVEPEDEKKKITGKGVPA